MIRDAINREVEAVDSGECVSPGFLFSFLLLITVILCCRPEYQLAKPSDSHRKEMLFGSLAKPGHPMGKFCWGELANTTAGTLNPHRASSGYLQARTNKSAETAARAPSHADIPARLKRLSAVLKLCWFQRFWGFFVFCSLVTHQEMHKHWSRSQRRRRSTCTSVCEPSGRNTTLPITWAWQCSPKVSNIVPLLCLFVNRLTITLLKLYHFPAANEGNLQKAICGVMGGLKNH